MAHDSPLSLKYFYIFNSSYCQREGEEAQKILYFYPSKTDLDAQIKNVGLTEAIIKFTETFDCHEKFESLHTQKTRQLYYQPEEEFWMVLVVSVPTATKTREGVDHLEYQTDDVQDSVYWAVLQHIYRSFRLFNGSFLNILSPKNDLTELRYKLNCYLSEYLVKLRLQHADILDVFHGIQFLPLDKKTFLHVQTLVNLLECSFPLVKHSAFLYNDQLVWSGLEPDDMQVVYRYLVNTLLPAQMETELQGGSIPRQSSSFSALHYGRFAFGPSNLQSSDVGDIPKVYLRNKGNTVLCHLVIYRALSATVCLFIDQAVALEIDFFQRLDIFLGHRLTSLASEIAEQCSHSTSASPGDSGAKFVYYNKLNRAQKSTVHLDNKRSGNIAVPTDVLRILADINADFMAREPTTGETIVKTMNDYWVVGKLSNLREFYVVIHQKNANLIEINGKISSLVLVYNLSFEPYSKSGSISEEVKKLCDSQFKSIFFLDNQEIERVTTTKYLGIIMDENLNWNEQIRNIIPKIKAAAMLIYRLKNHLKVENLKMIYYAYLHSHMTYMLSIWGTSGNRMIMNRLSIIQKGALKNIIKEDRRYPSHLVFERLNIVPIEVVAQVMLIVLMHNYINGKKKLNAPILFNYNTHSYPTRQANNMALPLVQTSHYGTNGIMYKAITLYNSIPEEIKMIRSTSAFKRRAKFLLLNHH